MNLSQDSVRKSLLVNLNEWKLETAIHGNETTHFSAASSTETWKRDRTLGGGGFGEVWKETSSSISKGRRPRVRAVKRIRKTGKATQELPNLIKLSTTKYYGSDHMQHFVEFFGWFEDQHNIYISMEYIPNHDLQHHIQVCHGKKRGFRESEAALIVMEITKALKFMHEKDVMHRDLKPANILISKPAPDWQIKLADFGISKDIELASAQTKAGTDGYMAPEVADTNRKMPYTKAVDIWSLGAVTFCLQTGKPPFQDNLAIGRYIDGKRPFPYELLLRFSGKLVIFIMQLMDVVSDRRLTVDEILEHEWIKQRGDVSTLDQETEIPDPGDWSAPASAEWPDSPDSSEGEPKHSIDPSGPSLPPNPNDAAAEISHPSLSPIRKPLSPIFKIHHPASNPVGMQIAGYDGPLPARPSSSPAEDVKSDMAPALIDNSKLYTYVESFRRLHDIDHKAYVPPDQPLAEPIYLQPPNRASDKLPWQLSHTDSGYDTSGSSPSRHPKNEGTRAHIKPEPVLEESPQPHRFNPPFKNYAEERNGVPAQFIGPLQVNQVRVQPDEHHVKTSFEARLSHNIENNLIDFGDPVPPTVDNKIPTPQFGPWPAPVNVEKEPVFGPWRPFENPWV
ncbi:hypothetical protein E0Z10_g242 [Xylaria hypoxylon]|uniref:non-specific serine/threonine protein kinase n=1 Tax=Xylaria hypoxylon TaxID=37992 RepID=A0A4Z0YWW7_9PEZI|nr:hypothetical protein E0Z10_g242 [Xylaria hypoxylon]